MKVADHSLTKIGLLNFPDSSILRKLNTRVDARQLFLPAGYKASILYLRIHYYTVHHVHAQCKIFKVYMYMCNITSMCVITCVCATCTHVRVHVHVHGIVSVYS